MHGGGIGATVTARESPLSTRGVVAGSQLPKSTPARLDVDDVDPVFRALSDFGALVFLAGGGVFALAILARRYEARILSEADFLRSANGVLAAGMERLSEELKVLREEVRTLRDEIKALRDEHRGR